MLKLCAAVFVVVASPNLFAEEFTDQESIEQAPIQPPVHPATEPEEPNLITELLEQVGTVELGIDF